MVATVFASTTEDWTVLPRKMCTLFRILTDDILDTLGGTKFFLSLDLAAGYWQIGMDEDSKAKSAFITHHGLYEFIWMPFGMCNTPATFQGLMELVLAGLVWNYSRASFTSMMCWSVHKLLMIIWSISEKYLPDFAVLDWSWRQKVSVFTWRGTLFGSHCDQEWHQTQSG